MSFPNPRIIPGTNLLGSVVGDPYYFQDFVASGMDAGGLVSTTAELAEWLQTDSNTGTILLADAEPSGALHIITDTADNDGHEFQLNGEMCLPAAGKDIYIEVRMKLTAAVAPLTTIDWFIGLATTDTDVMTAVTNRFGFGSNGLNAGNANIMAITEAASTQTDADTGVDYVDDTYFTIAAHMIGTQRIKYYVDGQEKANFSTNIATGALTPTIAIINNAGAAKQMLIDYVFVTQVR